MPDDAYAPRHTLLRRTTDYEVREYSPFGMVQYTSPAREAALEGRKAYKVIQRVFMEGHCSRTVPTLTWEGRMARPVREGEEGLASTSKVREEGWAVTNERFPGGRYAVRTFGGFVEPAAVARELSSLKSALVQDRVSADPDRPYYVAVYNDVAEKDAARRTNELWLPLRDPEFRLWPRDHLN
jgi:hypothetical protein